VAGSITDLGHGRVADSVFEQLALDTVPRAPGCMEALRARVLHDALDGAPPPGTVTFRAADRAWVELAPGVDIKVLSPGIAGCMTALVRMEAGTTYGAHLHPMHEECLVLSGEIRIGAHRLRAGDLHLAEAGTAHEATYAPHGALLFVRTSRAQPGIPA
jgi:quercetin dioxygenase-like cupin family protein